MNLQELKMLYEKTYEELKQVDKTLKELRGRSNYLGKKAIVQATEEEFIAIQKRLFQIEELAYRLQDDSVE